MLPPQARPLPLVLLPRPQGHQYSAMAFHVYQNRKPVPPTSRSLLPVSPPELKLCLLQLGSAVSTQQLQLLLAHSPWILLLNCLSILGQQRLRVGLWNVWWAFPTQSEAVIS